MRTSFQIILLFSCMAQDFVSCGGIAETLTITVGEPLTLECTYNCSSAFIRGCFKPTIKVKTRSQCPEPTIDKSGFCMVSFHLPNVSNDDVNIYICYTVHTDDPQLPHRIERLFVLQLTAQTTVLNMTTVPQTENKEDDFTAWKLLGFLFFGVVILAAFTVYLCVSGKRRNCKGDPAMSISGTPHPQEAVSEPVTAVRSAQSERVTLRIPQADVDDTEVSYADITITIRGVSTPELTQATGDQKEWWGDDSRGRLLASRSADRLHVPPPREISRKLSTNSEYAVITYA